MSTELKEATTEKVILAAKPRQTNCDQKDAKGKPCWGFLKAWTNPPSDLTRKIPAGEVLYRCQTCLALYHGKPIRHVQRSTERT
jgi:hypothetical protein